jgi:ribosomal protein S27E
MIEEPHFDVVAEAGKKTPYLRVSTSTTGQGYSRKSTRLTVTCGDCEELTSTPGALTLASSTGGHSHRELPGVDY